MKINKLSPNFEVICIEKTVKFYQEYLGFNLIMAVPESGDTIHQKLDGETEYIYSMVSRDDIQLMFQRSDSFKEDVSFSKGLEMGATVSFYMDIEAVDDLYESLKDKGLEMTEIKTTWYGMKEFYLKDLNGYILAFAEKV
ncbi:MAG: bleomycin resistance family protein [Clostridiales bacterium]|nr:MAG: bleomycin resistance family protein [Clostridiales bacterium]